MGDAFADKPSSDADVFSAGRFLASSPNRSPGLRRSHLCHSTLPACNRSCVCAVLSSLGCELTQGKVPVSRASSWPWHPGDLRESVLNLQMGDLVACTPCCLSVPKCLRKSTSLILQRPKEGCREAGGYRISRTQGY